MLKKVFGGVTTLTLFKRVRESKRVFNVRSLGYFGILRLDEWVEKPGCGVKPVIKPR